MTGPTNSADSAEGVGGEGGPATGMPRWVKWFLIAAIILAASFVVSRLAGVQHGPGVHGPGGGTPTGDVTVDPTSPNDQGP